MKYFCILTTGRSGSTSLINALAAHRDIITPDKLTESPDNELLHPEWIARYVSVFQQFTNTPIRDELQLIQGFFNASKQEGAQFAGFKSMPNRHRQLSALVNHPDIQIITLVRKDLPSTIASFLMAMKKGTWRRNGEKQQNVLTFEPAMQQQALNNLQYVVHSEQVLKQIPNAIHLEFESLCQAGFSHPRLNSFFQRVTKLDNPKTPVSAESYVDNWLEFKTFVDKEAAKFRRNIRQ